MGAVRTKHKVEMGPVVGKAYWAAPRQWNRQARARGAFVMQGGTMRAALRARREHFSAAVIMEQMPRYAINPPLHVRGSPGLIIRSTDDAVRFVRATSNPDDAAAIQLVWRLETVRNPEIAQGLADELRAWINRRGLSRVVH
jgi:hypothetical protein